MKQLIYLLISTVAVIISSTTWSQETASLNDQLELQQLQELACTGSTNSPELQSAITDLESMLSQVLTSGELEVTDTELQSAYNQAMALQDELKMHPRVQEFCDGY